MRAVVQDGYADDPADALRLDVTGRPSPGEGQVLVRVAASSVDRGTWHLMAGVPLVARPVIGLRRPKATNPGLNLAGVVEEVGPGVSAFSPGDEVFGIGHSTFAELAVAPVAKLVRRPPGVDVVAAAAVPVSGLTALQAVRDHGRVEAGERVLILGAAGGVGHLAVQLAAAAGAEVTAVCRASQAEVVGGLGAADTIDYRSGAALGTAGRYDVILDIAGNRTLRELRGALEPTGRLVIVGGEGGGRWVGGNDRQLRALLWSPFIGQSLTTFVSPERGEDLSSLAELMAAGTLAPRIDRSFPLEATDAAIAHLVAGGVVGKVAVEVAPASL